MMDNLPGSVLSSIDVRNASVHVQLLFGNRKLRMLDTQFVSDIVGNLNELVRQLNVTTCTLLSYLLKGFPDLFPADFPTSNRVHCRYGRTV